MTVFSSFDHRTVAVFGLGRTGIASARALAEGGATVKAWDDNEASRAAAAKAGLPLVDLYADDWQGTDALLLSPGIPLTHPQPHATVLRAREAGAEVIGDVELLMREQSAAKITGITGTNGKSTTTALIGHILRECGGAVEVGGNIGTAIGELATLDEGGHYVLELSSYQIDLTPSLHCDVAVLLNISPDHLDRHGGMAGYVSVKQRIFDGQGAEDTAVIGVDDEHCKAIYDRLVQQGRQNIIPVSVGRPMEDGVYVLDGVLFDPKGAGGMVADLRSAPRLPGAHNWQNAAAAYAATCALGFFPADIVNALFSFPGLAHRMELVGEIGGVTYVNDSKATNAEAAARALSSYDSIYWIAGGRSKEGGIATLSEYFPRIRKAYLIGEAAEDFAAALGHVPVAQCGNMETAVAQAAADAEAGSVVLLSPACASFDQYSDFEARGDDFRTQVETLREGTA